MSKDNKNPQWQKGNNHGHQDKKGGSCECPVGSGNNQHKNGSHRDERGKYNNNPNNENRNNGNGHGHEGKNRKFENE